MKKIAFLALCLILSAVQGQLHADDNTPEWVSALEQCDIVDSIWRVNDTAARDSNISVYHLYYHQPLCHQAQEGEQFQLRCVLMVRDDNDPETCNNEVYFGGYDIDIAWARGSMYFNRKCIGEIAQHYHGNLVVPEHRYFSGSAPDKAWEKLEWLNADEASQDFHALMGALKTVFRGKWVMTGVSKGGITTAMQHAFFPEDADIYVPNCGPYCRTMWDPRMHAYIQTTGWTPELRQRLDAMTRDLIEDTAAVNFYIDMYRQNKPLASDYECRKSYLVNTMEKGFMLRSYYHEDDVKGCFDDNDFLKDYIVTMRDDLPQPVSSYLNALFAMNDDPYAYNSWKEFFNVGVVAQRKAPQSLGIRKVARVLPDASNFYYSMTQEQWESNSYMPYFYQSALQLGQYTYDFHNIYTAPEERAYAGSLQELFTREELDYTTFQIPWLKTVQYDDYALFSMVEQRTKEATKPIVFLYALADPWTAATMDDAYVNGSNVRKYILDHQVHGVSIDEDQTGQSEEIWGFLDQMMAVETGVADMALSSPRVLKFVRDGRIILQQNGKQYNVAGQVMK